MSEDYRWVNVDKEEYFCPEEFDYGGRYRESQQKYSHVLGALHSLLQNEWKGDRILWLGDECTVPEQSKNELIREIHAQSVVFGYPGDIFDTLCESYRNVSCLFKEAEGWVRDAVECYLSEYQENGKLQYYNEYGIDFEKPYEGMFLKTGQRCEFTMNHSKRAYYSLKETAIYNPDYTKNDWADPLPGLMGYGKNAGVGEWVGDIIAVSDQRPEGYFFIKKMYLK